MKTPPYTQVSRRKSLATAISLFGFLALQVSPALAVVMLPGGGAILTTGSSNPGGKVVQDSTQLFSDPLGFFSGSLRSLVVLAPDNTFDFYFQITNTSQDPSEYLDGIVVSNFKGYTTEVDWSANGLDGIEGAGPYDFGDVPSFLVTRDGTPADDVVFFFPATTLNSVPGTNTSKFLIVGTDATNYGPGTARVAGAGLTDFLTVFGPAKKKVSKVPEGGSLLAVFGIAIAGLFYFSRAKSGTAAK